MMPTAPLLHRRRTVSTCSSSAACLFLSPPLLFLTSMYELVPLPTKLAVSISGLQGSHPWQLLQTWLRSQVLTQLG